jgi:hypothetical protein
VQTKGGTQAQLLVLAAQAESTLTTDVTSEVGLMQTSGMSELHGLDFESANFRKKALF